MAKIIETRTITTIGTGREDYSQSVELSTIPIIRSFQDEVTYVNTFYVPAYSLLQQEIPVPEGYTYQLYDFYLYTDSNVLIEFSVTINGITIIGARNYMSIEEIVPAGLPIGTFTLNLINYDPYSEHSILYNHHGIAVLEKFVYRQI